MPLAKTAEVKQEAPQAQPTATPPPIAFDGLPVDFYRLFGVEIGTTAPKELDKLKAIYEWSKDGADTIGDMMQKVSRLESHLGSPALNERRYDKMFRWVKMQKAINEIQKQQDAMRQRQWL